MRVSWESSRTTLHVLYALGLSSMTQQFGSLCSRIVDEHPTAATPKEQNFVNGLVRTTE